MHRAHTLWGYASSLCGPEIAPTRTDVTAEVVADTDES